MKAGGSKAKGSAFERDVAGMILEAAGERFKKKDCYRTPMSGGHVYSRQSNPSDLVISKRLLKLFPFSIECKHYRKLDLQHFFTRQGHFRTWIDQACSASNVVNRNDIQPIVVFKWNLSKVFCIVPFECYQNGTYLKFKYRGRYWKVILFSRFLKETFE